MRRVAWAGALGAALLALAGGGAGALELAQKGSLVLELFADDFDENKVPIYDGPGDFIAVAFYAPWCQQVRCTSRGRPRPRPGALSLPPCVPKPAPPNLSSPRPRHPFPVETLCWADPRHSAAYPRRRTNLCRSMKGWRRFCRRRGMRSSFWLV